MIESFIVGLAIGSAAIPSRTGLLAWRHDRRRVERVLEELL